VAVDDEIWRPGYVGPAPVSGETSFARATSPDTVSEAVDKRPWRLVASLLVVGAFTVAAVVAVGARSPGVDPRTVVEDTPPIDVIDDDRLEFASSEPTALADSEPLQLVDEPAAPFVGADPRRLPSAVVPLWTTELAPLVADGGANATTWAQAVDSRYIIVGVGDARSLTGPAAVHVLDASTGDRAWVMQVETRIDNVEFVAAIGDALVLTVGTEIVALDLQGGSQLWSRELPDVGGVPERIFRLQGTDLLGLIGPDLEGRIDVVDPITGTVAGEMIGDVLGTDGQGRWYVLRGDKLLEFDLRADDVTTELVGAVDAERSRPTVVVGGSLVSSVDGRLALGRLAIDGEQVAGPGGFTPLSTDFGTPGSLLLVSGFVPLGGGGFAIVGGGKVSGAEVLDATVRFAWQRRGAVTATYPTDRGVVLLLGTDGGAAQTLVDGASGNTIAGLTMSPGLFDALDVVGNGIVTRRTSSDGTRIAGLDLDGTELWALEGSTPVSVGDGVVVRSTPQPDGSFSVTAYGETG